MYALVCHKITTYQSQLMHAVFYTYMIVNFQVAFMPYRVNGQYIMEGLASSFLFMMGGLGFVVLDQTNKPMVPR